MCIVLYCGTIQYKHVVKTTDRISELYATRSGLHATQTRTVSVDLTSSLPKSCVLSRKHCATAAGCDSSGRRSNTVGHIVAAPGDERFRGHTSDERLKVAGCRGDWNTEIFGAAVGFRIFDVGLAATALSTRGFSMRGDMKEVFAVFGGCFNHETVRCMHSSTHETQQQQHKTKHNHQNSTQFV